MKRLLLIPLILMSFLLAACSFTHDLPTILEVDGRAFVLGQEPENPAQELVIRYFLYSIMQNDAGINDILAEDFTGSAEVQDDVHPVLYATRRIFNLSEGLVPQSIEDLVLANSHLYQRYIVDIEVIFLNSDGAHGEMLILAIAGKTDPSYPLQIHGYMHWPHSPRNIHVSMNGFSRINTLQNHDDFFAKRQDENPEKFREIDEWVGRWLTWHSTRLTTRPAIRAAGRYLLYTVDQYELHDYHYRLDEVLGNPNIHQAHVGLHLKEWLRVQENKEDISLRITGDGVIISGELSDLDSVAINHANTITLPDWVNWMPIIREHQLAEYAIVHLVLAYRDFARELGQPTPITFFERLYLVGRTTTDGDWKVYYFRAH